MGRVTARISAAPAVLPHGAVEAGLRGFVYGAVADPDHGLGEDASAELHADGLKPFGMRPFGFVPPRFPKKHRADSGNGYRVGGVTTVAFASPDMGVLSSVVNDLSARRNAERPLEIAGQAWKVLSVKAEPPYQFQTGVMVGRTATPVVVRRPQTDSVPVPGDEPYVTAHRHGPAVLGELLTNNAHRKAKTFGVSTDVTVRVSAVLSSGPVPVRVGAGKRWGTLVEFAAMGDPETLSLLWSWGLGESTSAGCGWIEL